MQNPIERPALLRHLLCVACALLLTALARLTFASDVVEVLPLTDRILLVHFDDGTVQIHKLGEPRDHDTVQVDPLDTAAAQNKGTYTLASTTDAAYSGGKQPTDVGRKSKGTEWANWCLQWNASYGCVNAQPDHAREHWLYLYLPSPLQVGATYQLSTGTLANNGTSFEFAYDPNVSRSEAVHVNQIGYAPAASLKYGYVYHWLGDHGPLDLSSYAGAECRLVKQPTGDVVFRSTLTLRKDRNNVETGQKNDVKGQNFSLADIYECDFSSFGTPGEYVLAVDRIGRSFPFRIYADAYREPFYYAMKGIFMNRSGIEIKAANGDGYPRPAPHHPGVTPGFAGRLKYTKTRHYDVSIEDSDPADKTLWDNGIVGDIDTWGWYQDAGDWDTYPTHSRIPALLMLLFEAHGSKFVDGELNIPESGNGIPDLLDEARWQIRFYHRTRHAILDAHYGTGGVGGARVMGDLWGGDTNTDGTTKASWTDTNRTWIVSGEDVWMTYRYAALAAQLAYNLAAVGKADPEGIDWTTEAEDAWTWASSHTKAADATKKWFYDLIHFRMHAAVALYRLTGKTAYHDQFKTDFATARFPTMDRPLAQQSATEGSVDEETRWSVFLYAGLANSLQPDTTIQQLCITALAKRTDDLLKSASNRGARWGGDFNMPMLVGQGTSPLIDDAVLSLAILKDKRPDLISTYQGAVYTTADYYLGNNPLNTTWATHMGERSPVGIFRMDSWYSGVPGPTPGCIPYGPWALNYVTGLVGPWSPNWVTDTNQPRIYPTKVSDWPGHEQWYELRTAPLTAEFTIWQTNTPSAVTYGSLVDTTYVDWRNPLEPADAGADSGVDGGALDGGTLDAGVADAGGPGGRLPPGAAAGDEGGGCGCVVGRRMTMAAGTLGAVFLAALALLGRCPAIHRRLFRRRGHDRTLSSRR